MGHFFVYVGMRIVQDLNRQVVGVVLLVVVLPHIDVMPACFLNLCQAAQLEMSEMA